MNTAKLIARILLLAMAAATLACNNDVNRSASPVLLTLSSEQVINVWDLAPGAQNCDQAVVNVTMTSILKNASEVDQRFNEVRLDRFRISYVRTDGGTLVPAPFVRSMNATIAPGNSATFGSFPVVLADAMTQAPFVSLLPGNGGRDPETGRQIIRMDVVMDVFGETLAGANVSSRVRFPLDFCYGCGGCS